MGWVHADEAATTGARYRSELVDDRVGVVVGPGVAWRPR